VIGTLSRGRLVEGLLWGLIAILVKTVRTLAGALPWSLAYDLGMTISCPVGKFARQVLSGCNRSGGSGAWPVIP